MSLFTVDVKGRPVVVFSSRDRDAAGEVLAAAISGDLAVFDRDGQPVWDGEGHQLVLREARPEEAARWEEGLAQAVRAGESHVVFLVEVVGPADGDEEDKS